ncbi:MAG: hypothetical protein JWQ30_2416 [Sediminibacterium sp.]|nr:hypothetical protein [Sediminibacterium sp.]
MKIAPLFLFLFILIISSCNNEPPKTQPAVKVEDTAKFYPLKDFINEQVRYVDLRNFPIYKITVRDAKKDSVTISKDQFIALAGIFLNREASFTKEKASFKESVFNDQSTGSITFNYQSTNSKTEVQAIDVLLDEQTNIVKRIFIRSEYNRGDTTVREQCNWKANKSFQVNRTLTTKGGYASDERNYINWNDK